jgi:dCMP deaminase
MNAIYKMARDGQSAAGATLFVTHAPCFECAKAILSVGIKNVWYSEDYRDPGGVYFLRANCLEVEKHV